MGRRLGWTGVMGAWMLALGLLSGVAGEAASEPPRDSVLGAGDVIPGIERQSPSPPSRGLGGDFPPYVKPLPQIPRMMGFVPGGVPARLAQVDAAAEELRRCMLRAIALGRLGRVGAGETLRAAAGRFCAPFVSAFAEAVERAGLAADMQPVTAAMAWSVRLGPGTETSPSPPSVRPPLTPPPTHIPAPTARLHLLAVGPGGDAFRF